MSSLVFSNVATLFNHYQGTWRKTLLDGVQWVDRVDKTVDSDGKILLTPEVSLTVPLRAGYVEPKAYTGEGFTFNANNLDVIVLGAVSEEITQDFTITDLRKKYDHVATIYGVTNNTLRPLLRHWRVTAR